MTVHNKSKRGKAEKRHANHKVMKHIRNPWKHKSVFIIYGYEFITYVKFMTIVILLILCLLFQLTNRHVVIKVANVCDN